MHISVIFFTLLCLIFVIFDDKIKTEAAKGSESLMELFDIIKDVTIKRIAHVIITDSGSLPTTNVISERGYCGFLFVFEGYALLTQHETTTRIESGTGIFLPRGARYTFTKPKKCAAAIVNFLVMGEISDTECKIFHFSRDVGFENDFKALKKAYLIGAAESHSESFSMLYRIISKLVGSSEGKNKYLESIEYVKNNYSDPYLTIGEIADRIGFSEAHFRKRFKEKFGVSPIQYIIDFRLNIAKDLLASTNLSMGEIAEKCGFTSAYYFSRIFKEKVGVPPLSYRKRINEYI